MPYFDVCIPLKLKNLTYYYDKDEDLIGFAVKVPLKNKFYDGIVIKKVIPPTNIEIRPIETVLGQSYSKKFVDFLLWMSYYYISEPGSILRLTFFEEIIKLLRGKKKKKTTPERLSDGIIEEDFFNTLSVNQETVSKIIQAIHKRKYQAFLIHTPNMAYEMKIMLEVSKAIFKQIYPPQRFQTTNYNGTVLFILPEIRDVEALYCLMKNDYKDEVVMLHSDMKSSELFTSIEKIISGTVKIVIGTRFAIFAPIKKLAAVIISQESSWLYKAEESPKYHARECALMRGFIEECPVILCSNMPSVISYFNFIQKKFEFIDDFNQSSHPKIRIFRQPLKGVFHPEVALFLKSHAKEGVIVISPRAGYSLLRCTECEEVIKCNSCGHSMLFGKENRVIECFRCNIRKDAPVVCPYCQSTCLQPIGVGVERLKEELSMLFAGTEFAIGEFESDGDEINKVYVTRAGKIIKTYLPKFKLAVFVDFDFFLSIPDYRATENAFSKVLSAINLIKNNGAIFIQTSNPGNEIFKYIKQYNFRDFYLNELTYRRQVQFPPFARLMKLTVSVKKTAPKNILEDLKVFLQSNISGEIMGPLKGNINEFFFILRSKYKRKLTEEANQILENLRKFKGISYKIEIDPMRLL